MRSCAFEDRFSVLAAAYATQDIDSLLLISIAKPVEQLDVGIMSMGYIIQLPFRSLRVCFSALSFVPTGDLPRRARRAWLSSVALKRSC